MAWDTLRARGTLRVAKDVGTRSDGRDWHTDQHPQSEAVDFLSGVPAAVRERGRVKSTLALQLSAVFMLMTFVIFVGYGLFAASIRDHVISRPRMLTWMRRSFAAAFVALGARLALTDR
jgi:threonine/homoserine/homoserine lactone efflux protein